MVLNYSYRGAEVDRTEMPDLAQEAGFEVARNGEQPFGTWDAAAYWLRRA